jgi:hypothetical protein
VIDGDAIVSAGFVRLFDLSVSSGPGGSIAIDPPSGPYADGSSVTLTALPDAGHRFGGWSGMLAGAENPAVIVIEADETITATFVRQPTLSVAPTVGGSVTLDPPGGVYDLGTSVTVSALPAPLHRFAAWSGALSGAVNPTTVIVDADRSVGASFIPQARLQVASAPGGSVALDPPGGLYDVGATVTLTATPDAGGIFAGWTRDLSGASSVADVVVDRDLRVGARFLFPVSLEQVEGGMSGNAGSVSTVGSLVAVDDDLYVAAIAARPNVAVTGVSGLGLEWTAVGQQCSGRDQTGVALWQARGHPVGDGVVRATLSATAQNAVLAVSRFASAGALRAAAALSANSNGVAGPCAGGEDGDAYALALGATTPGGLHYLATANRHRDHLPGSGYEERIELHKGSGGSVAGLAIADLRIGSAGLTAVEGGFSGAVDWALVAIEIPAAAPPPMGASRQRRR